MADRHFIIDTDKGKAEIYLEGDKLMYQNSARMDIVAENIRDFDVAYDPDGSIRLLCCNSDGCMLLYKYDWRSWKGKVIYDYSKDAADISQINILAYKSGIHLAYLLSGEKGSQAIFHHHWNGREWVNAIIDIPDGIAIKSVYMLYDDASKPHIIMLGRRSQSHCILHTYIDGMQWSAVQMLYSTQERIDDISICALGDIIHAAWRQYQEQRYRIMHGAITADKWRQPAALAEYQSKIGGAAILYDDRKLIVQWIAEGKLRQRISSDGTAWQDEQSMPIKDDIIRCKYIKEEDILKYNKVDAFTIRGEWCIIEGERKQPDDMKREDSQTLAQQMALLVDLYTDIKGMLLQMQTDNYSGRAASLRDAQTRQKQVGLDVNQLRQINEDIMKSSMHLQERNQLLERTNQALEQKVAEYERLLDGLKAENTALKKQVLEQMKSR